MPAASTFYPRVFALAVAALLGALLVLIFKPFLAAMSWAAFLAFVLHPVNLKLRRRLRGGGRAAGVLTVLTPVTIVLPLSALSIVFVEQISTLLQRLEQAARDMDIKSLADLEHFSFIARADAWVQAHSGISANQVRSWVIAGGQEVLQGVAGKSGSLFLGALGSVIGFSIMLSLLFFFLRDGDAMWSRARMLIPLDQARKDRLFHQLSDVTRAIVFGTSMTAAIQGLLVGIAFAIAGLPSPVVFGVLAALLSMLPVGGASFVWVPAVAWLCYQGRWGFAIFMLVWGVMLVGLESLLRPMLISGRARISALVIFVGVLGGIPAFGTIGIIVGPVVLSLALALIEFAEEASGAPRRA